MPNRYFRNTGSTAWATITNWSATDGGGSVGAAPTSADDVFFTALSGNVSASSAMAAKTINFTGYTGTWSGSSILTVSGSVTLSTGMNITTSATIIVNATATLTSNTKTWPNILTLSGAFTFTFADNWTVGGLFTSNSGTKVLTGSTLTANAGITMTSNTSGTTNIVLAGTGPWNGTGVFSCNVTINAPGGTITLLSGTLIYLTGTIAWIAGTVVNTGNTLQINDSCTLNTNGMAWNNITLPAAFTGTITNNSLCTINGALTHAVNNKTWAGTAGFVANTFTMTSITSNNHTFQSGVTYRVTNAISATNTNPSVHPTIKSSTGGVVAGFTLDVGATCNLGYINFTDIDASAGRKIYTFNGVISNSLNVETLIDPLQAIAKSFCS